MKKMKKNHHHDGIIMHGSSEPMPKKHKKMKHKSKMSKKDCKCG